MSYKKKSRKQKFNLYLVTLIIIIIILGIYIVKKPSITGKVILGKENIYSENLNIQQNESGTYNLTLKNPGSIKSLKATGSVSANGTARVYIEKNGTRYLLFDSTKPLFDVNINVLPEYKKVLQGGEILIQNTLFNLRGFGGGNVDVRYVIKDSKGNLIAAQEERVFIETQAKFIRELVIPAEIKPGTYVAFVEASANGTIVGTGSDTFEVSLRYRQIYPAQLKYYLIGVAVFVALASFFIVVVRVIGVLKKKRKITKLKERIPLEKVEKLKKELAALEKAYSSKFISEESYKKEKGRIEGELRKVRK